MTASESPLDSEPQLDTEPPPTSSIDEWKQSYRSLRSLFHVVLVCTLILTGSVFLFLLGQVRVTRRQVRELTQFVANHDKNNVPVMRLFRDKLVEFSKSNPDFRPILSKYINPTNYPGASHAPGSLPSSENGSPVRMPVVQPK